MDVSRARSVMRTRWAAIGAAVAVTLGGGGLGITHAETGSGIKPIFKPLASPCRLADLRPPPDQVGPRSAPLGPNDTYTLDGWGAVGTCNLPSDTSGLALNVTALNATQHTWLRFWAADGAVPPTANLNPAPGQPPTPNAVNVALSAAGKFNVFNRFGSVNVVIDVVGVYDDHHHDDRYYTETEIDARDLWAVVQTDGSLARSSNATSSKKIATGEYEVIFDRDVTQCVYVASAGNPAGGNPPARFVVTAARAGNPNGVFFEVYSDAGANIDMSFHVIVQC